MAAIEITPAGNQLYEAVISDAEGESRHEVAVPDPVVDRMDTGGVAMRDVVLAAVELLAGREGRQRLDARIDLAEVADRYEGFLDLVPERARELASLPRRELEGLPDGQEERPSSDERLVEEVRREQDTGRATPTDDRL